MRCARFRGEPSCLDVFDDEGSLFLSSPLNTYRHHYKYSQYILVFDSGNIWYEGVGGFCCQGQVINLQPLLQAGTAMRCRTSCGWAVWMV